MKRNKKIFDRVKREKSKSKFVPFSTFVEMVTKSNYSIDKVKQKFNKENLKKVTNQNHDCSRKD